MSLSKEFIIGIFLTLLLPSFAGPPDHPADSALSQCPSYWGVDAPEDLCLFPGNLVLLPERECFLSPQDVAQIKQEDARVSFCSTDRKPLSPRRTCTSADMPLQTNANLCVADDAVYGVSKHGDLTCYISGQDVVLGMNELPSCSQQIDEDTKKTELDRTCAKEMLKELDKSAVDKNLLFCGTSDERHVKVIHKNKTSCLLPKKHVPTSLVSNCSKKTKSSQAINKEDPNRPIFADGVEMQSIKPCMPSWLESGLYKTRTICNFRDQYFIWDKNNGEICRILQLNHPISGWNSEGFNDIIACPSEAFDSVRVVDLQPGEVVGCKAKSYKYVLGLLARNVALLCRVKGGYLLYYRKSNKVCRLPPQLWPQTKLYTYKPCDRDMLEKAYKNFRPEVVPRKRSATIKYSIITPPEKGSKREDIEVMVASSVPNWVKEAYPIPATVDDIQFNILKTASSIRRSRFTIHRRPLLQAMVEIKTKFKVIVFSQDVKGTDFPADLARALRKNVHKFDETGTYTVDPHSIQVKEEFPEVTASEADQEWKTIHTILLSVSSVFVAVVFIAIILQFYRRTSGAPTQQVKFIRPQNRRWTSYDFRNLH